MKGLHGYYFLLPLITFSLWITDIVGLLGLWANDDFNEYQPTNANIVFISNVGAVHKTFFIIFSSLSAAFYIATTLTERHLRHARRIPGSLRKRQTVLDVCSLIFAFIGAAGLVLLAVFDANNYSNVHWSMTVVFVVGVGLSVLFQTLQIFSLSKSHDDELWHLRAMAIVKTCLLAFAVVVLIVFVSTYATCRGDADPGDTRCDRITSAAGVAEWVCAFVLAFFFLTYTVDFMPARKRANAGLSEEGSMVEDRARAEAHGEGHHPNAPYAAPAMTQHSNTTLTAQQAKEQEKAAGQAY